jgi:hypothetical protein
MVHKIDNMIPTHVWVLQRIKAHGMDSDIKNGRSKFDAFSSVNMRRSYRISTFQKEEGY